MAAKTKPSSAAPAGSDKQAPEVAPAPAAKPAPATAETAGSDAHLTLRGYVIERPGADGEGSSWFVVGPGGGGWTWDKDRATVFQNKEDAKPLVARKRPADDRGPARAAGPASNEGAKIVKLDASSDDPV